MSPNRKSIAVFGAKRHPGFVRLYREVVDGRPLVRVQWREGGRVRVWSRDDTRSGLAEARIFAKETHDRLIAGPVPATFGALTVAQLYDKYVVAKVDAWRPRTLELSNQRWARFVERYLPSKGETVATAVTRETLDGFKRAMLETGRSANQVGEHIKVVTAVFRWGEDRELIPPTRVSSYRPEFSKEAKRQVAEMAEYSPTERAQILAQLDPKDSRQWRAWALTVLFRYCGPRQKAARHLEWRDVDLEAETITWRPELDKTGDTRVQPMPAPVKEAFLIALGWAQHDGYTGRWVFYSPTRRIRSGDAEPYTYQAYNQALRTAEDHAGVVHKKYRAAHGYRRGVATDIHALTGSTRAAADWIGDKSVKIVDAHYIQTRDEELRKYAKLVEEDQE